MLQFQIIVYAIIKIARRGTTVPVYEFAAVITRLMGYYYQWANYSS